MWPSGDGDGGHCHSDGQWQEYLWAHHHWPKRCRLTLNNFLCDCWEREMWEEPTEAPRSDLEIKMADDSSSFLPLPPSTQATLRPRSGRSGVCAPSRVAKVGKWGRARASPLLMGPCAAVPCGKRACATTPLPVPVNLELWAQVCVNPIFFF